MVAAPPGSGVLRLHDQARLNDLTAGGPERLTERMVGGEDEAQAVTRARGGDTEAFRFLVERHSRDVFRLAFRMTGNEHDAEDVVQETFLKAYRKLSALRGAGAVRELGPPHRRQLRVRPPARARPPRRPRWSARRARTATAR